MQAFQYLGALVALAWMMGCVFDIYNTVTSSSKWLRWLQPLLDLSFWLVSAGAVFYATYVTDHGRLRVYTFLVLLLGYGLYRILAHRLVVRAAFGVVRLVAGMLRLFFRIINVLVVRPIRLICRMIAWIFKLAYRAGCGIENLTVTVVRFILSIISRPLSGPFRRIASVPWLLQMSIRWEGIWATASKWLKYGLKKTE